MANVECQFIADKRLDILVLTEIPTVKEPSIKNVSWASVGLSSSETHRLVFYKESRNLMEYVR
jgi:hypothetical protein